MSNTPMQELIDFILGNYGSQLDILKEAKRLLEKEKNTMYVYIKSEPGLWTVGFYSPNGKWNTDSDHNSKQEAGERVAFLNGQQVSTPIPILTPCVELEKEVERLKGLIESAHEFGYKKYKWTMAASWQTFIEQNNL